MDEKERIIQLRKELHEHNYKYYVLNQPTIGDQEWINGGIQKNPSDFLYVSELLTIFASQIELLVK